MSASEETIVAPRRCSAACGRTTSEGREINGKWCCNACAANLRKHFVDVEYVGEPAERSIPLFVPPTREEIEREPDLWMLTAALWAASTQGLRLRFDPPDALRAELAAVVEQVRINNNFLRDADPDLQGPDDADHLLHLVERAERLVGQVKAREQAEEALRLLVDPDCDAREIWRCFRAATRALLAGRVCPTLGMVCPTFGRLQRPSRFHVCDPGPRIVWQQQPPKVL